jgi:N-carbamoylputrescine amidase
VVLAEAGQEEDVVVVTCDLQRIHQTRQGWPFLRDRRIDAYDGLEARWLEGEPAAESAAPGTRR